MPNYYGVEVPYGYQEMGVFEPIPWLNRALAYKPVCPYELEMNTRMQRKESFIEDMVAMQRSQVPANWAPPAGFHGQPATAEEKRPAVNNASDFATRVLVALGEMKPERTARIRSRRIA
jgi:hypothetical protein